MKIFISFIQLYLIIRCQSETLIYENFFQNFSLDWIISSSSCQSYTCQSKQIFGGQCFGSGTFIVKTIELNPHYKLRLKFLFWRFYIIQNELLTVLRNIYRIDQWNGYRFKVYIDNIEKHNELYYHSSSSNNLCGNSNYNDETFELDLNTYHQSSTTQILMTGDGYWGISDLQLFIEKCPDGCDSCDQNECFNQILFIQYFTTKTFQNVEGWLTYNGVIYNQQMSIGDYFIQLLSSFQSTKTIYLPPHDAVSIQMKIITLNYFHVYNILIDNDVVIYSSVSRQVFLNTNYLYSFLITNQINIHQYRHKHQYITLTIRMISSSAYTSSFNAYQGIRDFQLFIRPILNYDFCFDENIYPFDGCFAEIYDCVEGCSNCLRGVCLECQGGWQYYEQNKNCLPICGDSIITYFEECDDGNTYQYDGCYQCKYSCQQDCLLCEFGQCLRWKTSYLEFQNQSYSDNLNLKLPIAQKNKNHNQCQYLYDSLECYQYINELTWLFLTCESQYQMNEKRLKQYSKKKCGDLIITCDEECDDGNQVEYDGCYMCKYSCPLNCSKCQFGKCKQCQPRYELINGYCKYNCDGYEIYDDQENRNCINRIINLIENGDQQHYLFNNQNSQYKLVSSLTCNLKDFGIFGYFYNQCRTPVIQYCKESLYDKCLECDEYYKLENNIQICTPLCNDGIVIEREQCDDKNNIQFDGCYKCQQSCLLECLNCVGNKCYQCLDGWQLIDYSCYQYCGDGQVAKSSMEQCDDGNYNDGDGCYECKFECFPFCKSCADRNTCLVCEKYFELFNNSCKPICGDDYIIIGLEECEDGNDIPYDGCFNCQFQCEKECQICKSGLCIECIEGYMIIKDYCEVNNQTQIMDDEEDTQIQKKCGNGIYSNDEECDDGNLFQNDGCSILCEIEFNWFCNNQLNKSSICTPYTIIQLQYLNITQSIQYVQLSFSNKVKLNETISNFTNFIKPSIPSLQQDIYEITIIPVVEIDQIILLDVIYVLQIKILESTSTQLSLIVEINANLEDLNQMKVNTAIQTIYLQIPKILNKNQLQTANNFQSLGNWMMIGLAGSSFFLFFFGNPSQFINVEFPQNIQIYFESSEFVQIKSYYFYLTINPVLIKLKVNDVFQQLIGYQYLESVGKLFEYKLNADLLVNIYGQFTQIGFLIGLYIFIKYYKKLIYTQCFGNKYIYYFRLFKNNIIQSIGIKLYYINKSICKIDEIFNIQGLIQLFHANSWDLIFKILIFLASNQILGIREIVSIIISIGYLISTIIIVSQNCKGYTRKIILKDLRTQQHDEIILLKKLLFLVVLIIMQSYPLIQCILLTCILFWYLGSLISLDFAVNKLDLIIIIWMEAPVMLFTLSCMIYSSDFQKYFTTEQQIFAGFLQISLLLLALISPLVRCGYQFYIKARAFYLKNKKRKDPIVLDARNILFVVDNNK